MRNNYKPFKTLVLTTIVLLCFHGSYSQKQTNNWFFGIFGGLNFNTGSPVVLTNGVLNTNEGTSSISDANGNLLFYTEGVNVWNNTHSVMPNGTGLQGDVSTTQSALIVKKPGSASLYFIFTLPAEGSGNFCYSIVDMTLDGGKGDVTTKNTILKGNVTEKLTATYHCNGTDIWVVIHEFNTKSFLAYPVTAAGVGTPVTSAVGRVHTDVHGQMKFSPSGLKLACIRDTMTQNLPYQGKAYLDLHNFNTQTGVITYSLSLNLNNWQKAYGLEFSRDNSKVYATYYDQSGINGGNSECIQYDLSAPSIAASGLTVGASQDPEILRAMQLGPDGKIYVSKSNSPFLCVINTPTAIGAACSYSDNAINVDPNSMGNGCMLGLPGFVQSYFNAAFPDIITCPPTNTNSTVGITEKENRLISSFFYFDQYSNTFKITANAQVGEYNFKIYDLMGKVLLEKNFEVIDSNRPQVQFTIDDLSPGIYVSRISGPAGTEQSKFLKP